MGGCRKLALAHVIHVVDLIHVVQLAHLAEMLQGLIVIHACLQLRSSRIHDMLLVASTRIRVVVNT